MNRKQKIIVSITGIFIVLLALVGLTYAYFLTRITGNENDKSISVTTANLQLVYQDGNGILKTGKLEPSNDYITFLDEDDNEYESKIFTVTNNGNATVEGYKVYLENVQNQFERKDDLVYTLTCKSYINYDEETKAISGECIGVNTETTFPSVITSIVSNDIAVGVTHEYELKVKYKEMGIDQSVDMNKILSAKINIYDNKTKFLAREIMNNALSTATVTYNKSNYIEPTLQDGESYTIPAHATIKENERILTYTMDDYGTSYYFRGNVVDNYVNYAGMCWRVVRIEGDGSVKLILEDRYAECNDNESSTTSAIYTGNWSNIENHGDSWNFEGRVSFWESEDLDGSLADSFESFQTTKLTSTDLNKLKIDEWCYDDTVVDTSTMYFEGWDEILGDIVEHYYTAEYYGAYARIYTNKKPSLKCTGTKITKFNDEIDMYVGTLTADEIVFAGALVGDDEISNAGVKNDNYYLMNPYAKDKHLCWWSFSPYYFVEENGFGNAFNLTEDGNLWRFDDYSPGYDSRPAVSLKSGSVITEGVGTLEKPYIIG